MSAARRSGPMRQAETALIVDLAQDGRGVARVDGKTVFIDDALPGERVEWIRSKRGRNFDEGRLRSVLEPSADRVEPRCPHFGVCGGCMLQHLDPVRQLEFKQRQLDDALTRIGRVAPEQVLPPLRAGVWGYRRRARLAARWVPKKNRTVVGFRERNTPYVADLKQCEVLRAPVGSLLEPLSTMVSALSIRNRVPQIEVAVGDNAVAMIVRVLEPPTAADLELLRQFGREHRVQMYLQPGGYETVAPLSDDTVPLEYRLPRYDVSLQFLPSDFVQVNADLNAQMVERATELLVPQPSDRILDLFCGLGNFSLPLARSGAHVTGIEGDAALIARARDNADRNGLERVEFHCANLADASLCTAPWALRPYDKVLLDPPRAGAQEVLPVIARSGATIVLYISCHPGSLARDASILVHEHGFGLRAAGVMDMFPHTAHVESAALFVRSG